MRRTMEIVAAERLNKIGKSPSIVSTRADFEDDIHTVNELLMQSSVANSSGSDESLVENGTDGTGAGSGNKEGGEEEGADVSPRKKRGSSKRSIARLLSLSKARSNGGHDLWKKKDSDETRKEEKQQLTTPVVSLPCSRSPTITRQRSVPLVKQSPVTDL